MKGRRDFATLGLLHPRYQKAEQNVCVTFTPNHYNPRSLFQFQKIIKKKRFCELICVLLFFLLFQIKVSDELRLPDVQHPVFLLSCDKLIFPCPFIW